MSELMTPAEAARYLRTTEANLAYLRKRRSGPPYSKLGRQVRYRRERVDEWLAQQERPARGGVGVVS